MKYTFLMCVNKKHEFLKYAIASVLSQTDPDFEFFIIANNCNDNLWDYLNNIDDKRVKIYRTLIGQLSFNLNYGLNLIGSGYVLRMDADDICLPNRLELTKKYLKLYNWPDVLGGQAILINEDGIEIGLNKNPISNNMIRSILWRKCPITHPTCALNIDSILALRGYLGGFMSEDYDLWLRASRNPDFIFCNIDAPLLKYRINDTQSRGNILAYAEVAGFMLREALIRKSPKYYLATLISIGKTFLRSKR